MLVLMKKYLKEFSKKTLNYFVIFLSSIISGAIACNQSLGTILTYELCEELEDKQNMAIILENTIVLLAGLIPWNIAMAVPLKTVDIGLMSGLFAFYLYFLPLWNLLLGIIKEKRKIDITNEILSGDLIFANSEKAKELGLIDGLSTYEEIGVDYDEDTVDFVEYISAYKRKKNKSKNTIAIINLEGEIDTRESKESIINYDNVIEKLDELEDIKNLKGLVLRINSPGGSALESEKIYQKLKKLEIPIYISMGDLCASGGYYIATVGKKLFANPVTLTGSIGVVILYPEFSEAIDKLKVNMEGFSKGKGFDIFDVFSKLSEESKEKIVYSMNEVYSEFKAHVMEARNISEEDLEKIAGGRVWLGSQAKENGLVDELGTLNDCIDSLAKDLELKDFKLAYIRGRQSIAEIVSAMKPQFIKSDIVEKMEMLKSYSNKILYYDESLENL